jgi:plastocyanin
MKRREFVEKVGIGSAVLVTGGALGASEKAPTTAKAANQAHDHSPIKGDKAHATVAFGQWVPFDRFNNPPGPGTPPNPPGGPNDRTKNHHVLTPFEVQIKPGGAVSFIISGFHQPTIYAPGVKLEDINPALVVPGSVPPLIDNPEGRVFRGVDPRTVGQDRIENVTLSEPGTYLVICAVQPHFVIDKMHGFISVRGDEVQG